MACGGAADVRFNLAMAFPRKPLKAGSPGGNPDRRNVLAALLSLPFLAPLIGTGTVVRSGWILAAKDR